MAGPYATSDARNYVGIFKQAAKGTGGAPTLFFAYVPTVDLDHAQDISRILEAGDAGVVTSVEKLAHMPGGKFTLLARPSTAGKVWAYLLGVDAITGVGPYDHAITDDFVTDYLSIEQNLADEGIERFVDCAIAEINYVANVGEPFHRITVTWIGGTPSWQASATAESYEAATVFTMFDSPTFTVDGAGATNVLGIDLTVRRRFARPKVTDVVPGYLIKVGEDVEGEIRQLPTDISTEYRPVHYGSPTGTAHQKIPEPGSLTAVWTYGAGAAQRSMTFEINTLDYDDAKYSPLNPDGEEIVVTRPFVARKVAGQPLLRVTAKTGDSVVYV